MDLTVGIIEDRLRKYPKDTIVNLSCGCCHHGSLGNETILDIEDKTDQTYGYIELFFNATSGSNVELSQDREEFYKAEIEKLKNIINQQEYKLLEYEDFANSVKRQSERLLKF